MSHTTVSYRRVHEDHCTIVRCTASNPKATKPITVEVTVFGTPTEDKLRRAEREGAASARESMRRELKGN